MSDKHESLNRIADLYDERARTYGDDPRALYWHGQQEQFLRLRVLADIIPAWSNQRVLDVGCGFGDMQEVLEARGFDGTYVGVDVSEEIIALARKRKPEGDFQVRDILREPFAEPFDFVFASGTFNIRFLNNMPAYVEHMLACMHHHARCGVAVNFLSTYVDFEHEEAYHSDPKIVFDQAMQLGSRPLLRHDYMPYEFTLYTYRDRTIRRPGHVYAAWVQGQSALPGDDRA